MENAFDPWRDEDFPGWKKEAWDVNLPQKGFITDYVLASRGFESPTFFGVWTAIHLLSATIKREACLEWFPDPLIPNFYIVLVAPPRINAKSTTINFAAGIGQRFTEYIKDPTWKAIKTPQTLRSRATSEALVLALQPQIMPIQMDEKTIIPVERYSQANLVISELATFLGQQKYNVGLVEKLTDLYDGLAIDTDLTITRGLKVLKNVYVTLMGATTPGGLQESIPASAFGDGFMSRTIIAYHDKPTRLWPFPQPIVEGSDEGLARRLAWIAETVKGIYALTPEAKDAYVEWYTPFKEKLASEMDERKQGMTQRFDNHLLKLALIMRAQRYTPGTDITLEDFQDAKRLLDYTFRVAPEALRTVGLSPYQRAMNRVLSLFVKHEGEMTRKNLLQSTSSAGITAEEIDKVLDRLQQEGRLKVSFAGRECEGISKKGTEVYRLGGKDAAKGQAKSDR